MDAIRNGQLVARNVEQLAQDDGLPPIFNALTVVVGRGWLWGHERNDDDDNNGDNNGESHAASVQEQSERPRSEGPEVERTVSDAKEESLQGSEALQNDGAEAAGEGGQITEKSPRRRLSGVMERMAECLEKGMITNQEKNSFMELLTRSDVEEQAIRSVERTLDGLVEQHQTVAPQEESASDAKSSVSQSRTKGVSIPLSKSKIASTKSPALDGAKTEGDGSDNFSAQQTENTNVEPPQIHGQDEKFPTSVSQASSWDVAEPDAVESERASSSSEMVLQRNAETPPESAESRSEGDGGGEDVMKIFGATLAVAGAVVGGMALLQRAHNDHEEDERAKAQPPEVVIEELNDDDDDEWVSVSQPR